jgi:outer membrane protein assembly factor BamB
MDRHIQPETFRRGVGARHLPCRVLSLAAFSCGLILGATALSEARDDAAEPDTASERRAVSPPDRWTQFRGSLLGTGRSEATVPDDLGLLWSFEAGFSIDSSAAIFDGVVYMTALPGLVAALRLEDGAEVWRRDFGDEEDRFGESSPTIAEGALFVGDLTGEVHSFDLEDGSTNWTFETSAEIKSSPIVIDDTLLIGSYDEHLYALDRASGELRWKFQSQGPIHSTPGLSEGLVFVTGCDARFRGLKLEDGTEALQIDSGAYTAASPALVDGIAYYGTFNNDVLAIDFQNQEYLWRYEHPTRHFPFYSSAAVADGKVVVGGRDKIVHGIDQKTGESLWTFRTGARVESSPVIAGERVYIGSADGRFYVLDLDSGEKVWEFNAGGPFVASPAIASGRIVIGTQDGVLYCFGKK